MTKLTNSDVIWLAHLSQAPGLTRQERRKRVRRYKRALWAMRFEYWTEKAIELAGMVALTLAAVVILTLLLFL